MRTARGIRYALICGLLALVGCTEHHDDPNAAQDGGTSEGGRGDSRAGSGGTRGGSGSGGANGGARDGELPPDGPACVVSQTTAEIAITDVDKVDLLFMVDNSGSMTQEQAALREQFPRLISSLATGELGDAKFPPIKDLHLGVVSSDLGLVGISDIDMCTGQGDDGILQSEPRLPNCLANYPRFLSYTAGLNDPTTLANDFACVSTLGTNGCGFEQQLESVLKALWPASDNRVTFLGDVNGFGTVGHGDTENDGFLRNDPARGLSLITVILLTDEEDCSSSNTVHFTPNTYLDPNNPQDAELLKQGLNTRCHFNPQNLYDPMRYINGLRALRPGNENLVVFGAIVGVPPDIADPGVAQVDFADPAARDQFYTAILNDQRMQPVVETNGTPDPADDTMRPSCNTASGLAYPPRRIVEVARGFGENGVVQSICQPDLGPAIDAILTVMTRQLGAVCLPRPLVRDGDGLVGCDVVWELPAQGMAPRGTPVSCDDGAWPFLLPTRSGAARSPRGGARCRVPQLSVLDGAFVPTETDGMTFSDGWYYDDFSDDVSACRTSPKQRIAFTPDAKPPTGVTVKLECLNQGAAEDPEEPANSCSAGEQSANDRNVGDPCLPASVPENGFDPREAYLETSNDGCGGGVCIVYRLDGDPSEGCIPDETKRCPGPSEVERSVYCTCRCDAPEGFAQCACPDGFSCVTALEQGGDGVRGGYCVRNGTVSR